MKLEEPLAIAESPGSAIAGVVTSLKEMITFYGIIADLFAFVVLVIAPVSLLFPWWPDASIRIIVWLVLTLIALVISFTRALAKERTLNHSLVKQVQVLGQRPEIREANKLILDRKLTEAVDSSDSMESFLQHLQSEIFDFLIEAFGFPRVALCQVVLTKTQKEAACQTKFLFARSRPLVREEAHNEGVDKSNSEWIVSRGDTSKPTISSLIPYQGEKESSFVHSYLPIADPSTPSVWYVFAAQLQNANEEDVQKDSEFVASDLFPKLKQAFTKVGAQVAHKDIAGGVRHSHICAILRRGPGGTLEKEYLPDLPKSDLDRLKEVLSSTSRDVFSQAFNVKPEQSLTPIVVSADQYNLSLVPLLMGSSVHGVIAFLDEAGGRPLQSDQTRWHSLYGLSNYLYRQVGQDKLTGLATQWFIERQLQAALPHCKPGALLGVILVGLRSETNNWVMPTKHNRETLRQVGTALDGWAKQNRNPIGLCNSLAARWEGGIYMLLISVGSRENAHDQASAIKAAVDRQLTPGRESPKESRIGAVVVGTQDTVSVSELDNIVDKAFSALESTSNSSSGICIVEYQVDALIKPQERPRSKCRLLSVIKALRRQSRPTPSIPARGHKTDR